MTTERERQYQRAYRAAHRAELNAYKAEWARTQRRLKMPVADGWRAKARAYQQNRKDAKAQAMAAAAFTLHDLGCGYPTVGCRCRPIVVLR